MTRPPWPRSHHFRYQQLAEGVAFAEARGTGTALANAGIVDLDHRALLFDTSLTLRSGQDLVEAARSFTHRRSFWTVNSHWHLDHLLGNQLVSGGPIWATRRTIAVLRSRRRKLLAELRPDRLVADLQHSVEQGPSSRAPTRGEKQEMASAVRITRALVEEAGALRLTLPTRGFSRSAPVPGRAGARLLTYGAGHTDSDGILFLEPERVLFAGDLVVTGRHPNLGSGDPDHWRVVLDRLEALRPELIATGHGPLGTRESLEPMRDYLETVGALADRSSDPAMPARFRRWGDPSLFAQNLAFLRARKLRRSKTRARAGRPPRAGTGGTRHNR